MAPENTKENRAERIKREKDGLDVWADIERYAETGFQAIDPDDLDRFKWYGLYTQRPAEEGFFMLRIRIPNGVLSSEQLETIGWLSRVYARSTGDITTRQCIQLHYVRIQDVPVIVRELGKVGLTTQETCGDVVRNVVGSPLAGIEAEELIDALPIVEEVSRLFLNDYAFSNLPRKFKISISGSSRPQEQHQINDIGLVATVSERGETGFDLWVGGGLGAVPHLGKRLNVFVRPQEVSEVITRVVEIFRDHGNRDNRKKARMKFLVAAWGVERFRAELEARLGRRLTESGEVETADASPSRWLGVGLQKNTDADGNPLYYLGLTVLRGRISGEQMVSVAGLARFYASGRIRLTNTQNLIVPDVPERFIETLSRELAALDLRLESSPFRQGTVACTGRQFCKLAVVETKDRAAEIVRYLEGAIPDFRDDIRISVTGCVNSCAQYQIADIGLVGVKGQENGEEVDYFQIHLGGQLGRNARFGRKLSKRVRVEEAKYYIERLIHVYRAQRLSERERFSDFIARHELRELETLDEQLASALELEEVLR
ncbi:MAG TPA: nitrite/sulfite reductase [Blastocatellia bacterium]|nr:nitrite/sulfite reductase [Blastocatellia bacterium]